MQEHKASLRVFEILDSHHVTARVDDLAEISRRDPPRHQRPASRLSIPGIPTTLLFDGAAFNCPT